MLAAAGAAQAQQINLGLTVEHPAFNAGMPRVITGPPAPENPSGGTVTLYSVTGTDQVIALDGYLPKTKAMLASDPVRFGSLIPAQPKTSYSQSLKLKTIGDLTTLANNVVLNNYSLPTPHLTDCTTGPAGVYTGFGLNPSISAQPCGAVTAWAQLNGVRLNLTAPVNKVEVTAKIPLLGYSFTSVGAKTRGEALKQIWQNFDDSPTKPRLISALLGKPASFTLPVGSLPRGSKLLSATLTVTPLGAASVSRTAGVDSIGGLVAYGLANEGATLQSFGLPDLGNCRQGAGKLIGSCPAVSASIKLLNVQVVAMYLANSPDATFTLPQIGYSFTSSHAADRSDAIQQFLAAAKANQSLPKLASVAWKTVMLADAANPLIGNPNSLQSTLARDSLDMSAPSLALGESEVVGAVGNPFSPARWMLGGQTGRVASNTAEMNYVDAEAEFAHSVFDGSGGRLRISAPVSAAVYDGEPGARFAGALRVGYEQPLLTHRWVVEPSVGVAVLYDSSNLFESGAVYSVGLASRFKLATVGRGDVVIGNAVSEDSTVEIPVGGGFATPKIRTTTYRNGLAYQTPLGGDALGRQGAFRASYTYTCVSGDKGVASNYHEVALNYGVGPRNRSGGPGKGELRLGLVAYLADAYTAEAVRFGYTF
jgi:hypothetical protein